MYSFKLCIFLGLSHLNFQLFLLQALKAEENHQRWADEILKMDERKRPYNSMFETKAPTDAEMEAFYMKRMRADDPMAAFIGKE